MDGYIREFLSDIGLSGGCLALGVLMFLLVLILREYLKDNEW